MSSFEKAFDSVGTSLKGAESISINVMQELSPVLGNNEGTSIINAMRGSSSELPKGFTSSDNLLGQGPQGLISSDSLSSQSNPLAGVESLLGGGSNGAGGLLGSLEGALGGGGGGLGGILGEIAPVIEEVAPLALAAL